MDEYYDDLYRFLSKQKSIFAYPLLHGIFFWENDTLYEMSNNDKYPRAFIQGGFLLSIKESKKKCASFVMPRECSASKILDVLKKIEQVNGTMLVRLNDDLIFLNSYTCYLALSQFSNWICHAHERYKTWDDFLNNTLIKTDDEEMNCFVFKNVYYFVSYQLHLCDMS